MELELNNGIIEGLYMETKLIDMNSFSFSGYIIYSSFKIEKYPHYVRLGFLGKCTISDNFTTVIIDNMYIDEEIQKKISKLENFDIFEVLIHKDLNSYHTLENLSIQKMNFIQNNKSSYNIEHIKLNSNIEYSDFLNIVTVRGNLYTNKKSKTTDINIFNFDVECFINNNNEIKVRNCDLNTVFENDDEKYELEILQEYVIYFIEKNSYLKDYINSKKLETYDFI